ncbi:uncharacterized protein LOC131990163 [Centropristis striata]|uniref:uncharacterized protein LOC131990163 n=1 Tax=Centropristis striata TaxID=184440 RepID=UPI0027E11FA8|nr:uncharacterized protein LOC131990163 [Centropristis striata]
MESTFLKDGSPVGRATFYPSSSKAVMIIGPVSASDRGSYTCQFDDGKESEPKELKVEAGRRSVTLTAEETVIPAGGAVTLTCSVDPAAGLMYRWFRLPSDTPEVLAGNRNKLDISQGGEYSCRGRSQEADFFTPESNAVTVDETVSNKASVTIQPTWAPIFRGETFTVRCEIEGREHAEWTYEWKPDKLNSPPTHNEYRIISAADSDGGEYKCKGRRDSYFSTQWSNGIRLDVRPGKPKAELRADSRLFLSCSVTSSSGWKFFWYRGEKTSEPLTKQDAVFISTERISVSQGGVYWCRGGRGETLYYTDYSDSVIIYKTVSSKATVSRQPNWPQIFTGEKITLRCEIQGGGDLQWTFDWRTSSSNTLPAHKEHISSSATESHSGDYRCMGRLGYSFTQWSDLITLTVTAGKPKAGLRADSRDIPVGGRVTLSCSVTSSSGWKFFWYRGEKTSEPLTKQDAVFISTERISVSQGGVYWCRGGRGETLYYTDYSHSVLINNNVANRAVVTLQPNWSEIYRGETITVRCDIKDGGDTEWEYEWKTTSRNKPSNQNEHRVRSASESDSGTYSCRGRRAQQSATDWSDPIKLTVSDNKPEPVLTVSPSWLSPGDSVTLNCRVKHPSAGWRFSWYKAVPKPSDNSYSYELLPDSTTGTEQDSYIVHGQTHTAGYVCRAGRGDPVYHTDYSQPQFVWSGDFGSSASLTVSPDRVQHFTSDSVSLSCEGNSAEWRVKRFTDHSYLSRCSTWGTMTGSTCNIHRSWYSDTGVYWCESRSGEFSNAVNITQLSDNIILVSPVHPVTEGDSVSLSCRLRRRESVSTVFFYRNEELVQNDTRRELNISAVSKSDEGFYKCGHSGEESAQSWMSVKGSSPEGSKLPVALITGLLSGIVLVVIILLLLFCYRRTRDSSSTRPIQSDGTNQGSATGHMVDQNEAQCNEYSSPPSAAVEPQDVTYSLLELKNIGQKARQHKPEDSAVYSEVKVGTADDNLMYAQVNCLNKGKGKKKKGESAPAATEDTLYSELKPGTALGNDAAFFTQSRIVSQKQSQRESALDVNMGHTLLCVLGFFSLNMLFYCGHAQDVLLTIEPKRSTVFTGESVTFMCDTRGEKGDNWYYSISKDDQLIINYNRNKTHTEKLQTTLFSGEYQCLVGTGVSTIRSNNKVSLTVSDKDVILETPASSLFEGESVTLGCRYRDPTKNKNAVFYQDGSAVEMDTNLQSQMMKNTVQVISNRSSSYMCKFGDEESEPIKLKIQPQPKAHLMDYPAEGNVTLTCSVETSSSSGWKFFWYKGEKTSEPLTKQDAVLLSSGQITVSRGGVYWCRGGRGEPLYYTEYSHSVVTNRAVVSLQPNWPEIYSGETITLTCEIEDGGDTEWEYKWTTRSSTTSPETKEYKFKPSYSEDYGCKGVIKGGKSSTKLSDVFTLTPSFNKPEPVLTVSPSWLSPGDSVTLNCRVKHPSAGWRFSWYKAVPKPSDNSYSYELLPDSTTGTEQDSYIVHGQTHTAGYVCMAGRGDPVYHTDYSKPQFVWSGDFGSSASLTVSPDRVQHFISDSVSLSCEGNSTEWRVKRFTDGYLRDCSIWGTMTGSTCKVDKYWLSGVYWCESGTGEFSNAVNITIEYGHIILLSPVPPVTEGRSVTLGCKLKTQNYIYNVVFYKNGKIIQNDTREELNISAVSKSDEGFYKCKGDHSSQGWLSVTSPESWISVKSASRPENNPPFPVLLVVGLVGGVLLIILLLLFLLLCCYRKSKDSCFNSRSQRSNQSPATDQDGSQHTGCASTLQGDVCHYESIKDTHETENDKSRDATYSVVELKNMRKDDEAHQNALYSTVEMASAADDNLTYAQVHTKMNAEKGKSSPAAAADETVYSEVKPGTAPDQ